MWDDRQTILAQLQRFDKEDTVIVHTGGGCKDQISGYVFRGAELMAAQIAQTLGIRTMLVRPEWSVYRIRAVAIAYRAAIYGTYPLGGARKIDIILAFIRVDDMSNSDTVSRCVEIGEEAGVQICKFFQTKPPLK